MEDVYELFVRGTELLEAGHNHQATIPLARARDLAPDKTSIRERWVVPCSAPNATNRPPRSSAP